MRHILFRLLPTVVRLRNVEILLHITIFFAIVILMDVIQSRERKWSRIVPLSNNPIHQNDNLKGKLYRACKSAFDVLCFRNYSELVGLISEYVEIDSSCFALGSRINFPHSVSCRECIVKAVKRQNGRTNRWRFWRRALAQNVSNLFYHFSSVTLVLYFLFTFNTAYAASYVLYYLSVAFKLFAWTLQYLPKMQRDMYLG